MNAKDEKLHFKAHQMEGKILKNLSKDIELLNKRLDIQRESIARLFNIVKKTVKEFDHVRSIVADSNRSHLDS